MRLALKLVLAFMLANIALAAIYGYLAVRRECGMFEHTASDEADSLGPAMQVVLADAWRATRLSWRAAVRSRGGEVQETELHIRWVWFDSRPGDPDAPSAPREPADGDGDRAASDHRNFRFRRKRGSRYLLARSAG